jgi:hypothetical protein
MFQEPILTTSYKLSATQIETLLAELPADDPTIARTVPNTAMDAARIIDVALSRMG